MEAKHEVITIELTIENGVVTYVRKVQKGEITASLDTFFWLAKQADYKIIPPQENTQES
ncbi:hypothetical protein SB6412_03379 [Klebsiella pasteurii]|uniref:hypothetical protein n=1 Tax=Klebsiella TaxID=570 RepID=UPI00116BC56A|nr:MULTISPECIES: hypothetical protein [Klebsiella]QPF26526.1 hypothetical protein IYV58_20885 [Klebsiella sp. BDA134-6]VUS68199.1 hypothetical protein SB6412_03379 [Klebsiella pasteurii]